MYKLFQLIILAIFLIAMGISAYSKETNIEILYATVAIIQAILLAKDQIINEIEKPANKKQ